MYSKIFLTIEAGGHTVLISAENVWYFAQDFKIKGGGMIKVFKVCTVITAIFLTTNFSWAFASIDDKSKVIFAAAQLSDNANTNLGKIEKEGVDYFVYEGSFTHHDIQERNLKLRSIIEKAGKDAEKNVAKGYGGQLPDLGGICGLIWAQQKRILKEKYNIDWKTPQEMNPGTRFD